MKDTISGGGDRRGKICSLLLEGAENAIPASMLAQQAGCSPRALRRAIDAEREAGGLILADDNGYYLPALGREGIQELRRFIRRTDARMASNRRSIRPLKAALKELEGGQIDGQCDLFGGDDG